MNRPEQQLQRAVVEYLELVKPRCIWFHPPNGGARSKTEAAILKGLGVKAGVADLIFLWKNGSGCIELKTTGKQLSKAQNDFSEDCWIVGVNHAICFTVDQVDHFMKKWGLIDPGRAKIEGKK
jgi:hypothetical protein